MDIILAEEIVFSYLFLRLPLVLLFSLATLGLQVVRSRLYGYRFYRPFLLNIVLAWIPIGLSVVAHILFLRNNYQITPAVWLILAVWFFFFPNAIYLITEVHHFRDESKVPLWFDTIALLSIVLNGVLLGSYSLMIIHFLLRTQLSGGQSWLVLVGYVLLANFGIFIGRYLRFNSWDVVRNPLGLLRSILAQLRTREQLRNLLLYMLLFSFFILVFYLFIELDFQNLYGLGAALKLLRGS